MASLNKILSKVNQALGALSSVKGIKAKITNTDYRSVVSDLSNYDALKSQADTEREILEGRRSRLNQDEDAANKMKSIAAAKRPKKPVGHELQYPLETLPNYLHMRIRPRKQHSGQGNSLNLLSEGDTDIYMYVPHGMNNSASVQYSEKEIGTVKQLMLNGMTDITAGDISAVLQAGLQSMVNKMTGDVLNFAQGQAVNPMKEQMLQGLGFRSFSFEFHMKPKSQKEADVCKQIIWTLRTAMLPDTFGSAENSQIENYFNYPNIVDMDWEGPIASAMDSFLPSVITQCDVVYGGDSSVETFWDGTPLEMKISITTQEIKVLSQENYQKVSPYAVHPDNPHKEISSKLRKQGGAKSILDSRDTGAEERKNKAEEKKKKGTAGPKRGGSI